MYREFTVGSWTFSFWNNEKCLPKCQICDGGIFRVEDEKHGHLCLWHFLSVGSIEYHGGDVDLEDCSRTSARDAE